MTPSLRPTAVRKRLKIEVSEIAFAYLSDDPDYESREGDPFEMLDLLYPSGRGTFERTWQAVRDEIMERWTVEHPGTRPRAWWRVDAPRWDDPYDDSFYHGTFAQPRMRLGGKGTPIHECLNYAPCFEFGLPASFLDAWDFAFYAEHSGGLENVDHPGEPVEAFDPKDPPAYESQARYLWDRDLLEPKERKAVEKLGLLDQVEVVERQDDEVDEVTQRVASKHRRAS